MYLAFQLVDETIDTDYWNICLCIYNKRKHIDDLLEHTDFVGKNPLLSIRVIRTAFDQLEKTLVERSWVRNNYVFCSWTDNRRRDVYYRYLSRKGYAYGKYDGRKVIYKIYDKMTEMVN